MQNYEQQIMHLTTRKINAFEIDEDIPYYEALAIGSVLRRYFGNVVYNDASHSREHVEVDMKSLFQMVHRLYLNRAVKVAMNVYGLTTALSIPKHDFVEDAEYVNLWAITIRWMQKTAEWNHDEPYRELVRALADELKNEGMYDLVKERLAQPLPTLKKAVIKDLPIELQLAYTGPTVDPETEFSRLLWDVKEVTTTPFTEDQYLDSLELFEPIAVHKVLDEHLNRMIVGVPEGFDFDPEPIFQLIWESAGYHKIAMVHQTEWLQRNATNHVCALFANYHRIFRGLGSPKYAIILSNAYDDFLEEKGYLKSVLQHKDSFDWSNHQRPDLPLRLAQRVYGKNLLR